MDVEIQLVSFEFYVCHRIEKTLVTGASGHKRTGRSLSLT